MYLQNYLPDRAAIVTSVAASPKIKKHFDDDTIRRVLIDTVSALAQKTLRDETLVDLSDALAVYEVANGKYDELPQGDEGSLARDNYEAGVDDAVENVFAPLDQYLSADWLGRSTIDTRLWEDGALEALADSAAKELWKQITHEKSPAQILSNAGFGVPQIQEVINAIRSGDKPMTADTPADDMDAVLLKIKTTLGDGFDQLAVYEDFETIFGEDDEILAFSAASRIGLNAADVMTLQVAALAMDDPASETMDRLNAVKVPSGRAVTKEAKAAKAAAKAQASEGAVDPSVVLALKECGAGDTAMAERLGVSRSTYTQWFSGKAPFTPTDEQHQIVRSELVARANTLHAAIAKLDQTEPLQVA